MERVILSLMQPWADLIVSGRKTIELRKWNTKLRGEFFVHASMKTDIKACKEVGINPETLINGAVIGKCTLVDIREYNNREELRKDNGKHFAPKYDTPCYGFLIKDAKRIKPVIMKGQLGFYKREI